MKKTNKEKVKEIHLNDYVKEDHGDMKVIDTMAFLKDLRKLSGLY